MKRFCEECGYALPVGSAFCEECGSAVDTGRNALPQPSATESPRFSGNGGDLLQWLEGGWLNGRSASQPGLSGLKTGVLFTNSKVLRKLGFDAEAIIRAYVVSRLKDAGVAWHVLDRARGKDPLDGDLTDHLDYLKNSIDGRFELTGRGDLPLLIFGNEEVIPMAVVEDQAEQGNDGDVDTDLPYALLSDRDPWTAPLQNYAPYLSVGRIPLGRGFGVGALQNYLNACRSVNESISAEGLLAVSAACWKGASSAVHKELLAMGQLGSLHFSPRILKDQLRSVQPFRTHWHYFNVHGADTDPDWFGESEDGVTRACSPEFFATQREWNIVGVEACYGARFIGDEPADSALLSALGNKTVAFVGASRIAYGPPEPPNGLADVLIRDFLRQAMNGSCVGSALSHARSSVLASPFADPNLVSKTVLEFNLFGDPLLKVRKGLEMPFEWSRPAWSNAPLPRIQKVVPAGGGILQGILRMTRDNSMKIQEAVTEMLLARYPGMKGVVPQVWTITGSPAKGAQADETLKFLYHSPSYMGRRKDVIVYSAPDGKLRHLVESK